ncbi:MAG TPA: hypothetical protein VEH29_15830 [Acidimicrobiales bacterium]|nr:hypothetical protein [Acidimicrobiales bacterium]
MTDPRAAASLFSFEGGGAGPFGALRLGRVVEYEFERGLGSVAEISPSGAELGRYRFHCTAIADGSRNIEPGTPVVFALSPGLGGVLEARAVTHAAASSL